MFLAFAVYSPTYAATSPTIRGTFRDDPTFLWICTAFWAVSIIICSNWRTCLDDLRLQFAEYSNLASHLTLRSLRPEGSRQRGIPFGYGFSLVSCPNYFFEILGWATIVVMTGSWAGKPNHYLVRVALTFYHR